MKPVASALLLLAAGCTCRPEPTLTGEVVDWWGEEVEGATVTVVQDAAAAPGDAAAVPEGPLTTSGDGTFTLPMRERWTVRVEAPGFVPRTVELEPESLELPHRDRIELVPLPPGPGFHIVGADGYVTLPGQAVLRTGDERRVLHGIASMGEVEVEADPLKLVFHTPLKMEEVARLDIQLHRLTFLEDMQVASVDGEGPARVDLFVSAGAIDRCPADGTRPDPCFVWVALDDGQTYAVRADDLTPGRYAFVSMNLLTPGRPDAFEKIAPSIRRIHPFTVE